MEGQITLAEWQQWKQDIKNRLNQTVENFIFIGYRLRQIQETEAYRQDGFKSLEEFAREEYNLSASTVSRFMSINARFSIGGNGMELLPEFKGMAYSKLQEMLTIPETDYELLRPKSTVKEIRELREFNHADPVQANVAEPELMPLQTCIKDYFSQPGRRNLLNETMERLAKEERGPALLEQLADNINPSGYATHKKGIVYLFLYEFPSGAMVKTMGKQEARRMTWEELLEEIYSMYEPYRDEQGETWCNVYGPAKEEKDIPGQMDITQVLRPQKTEKTKPRMDKEAKREKKPEKPKQEPAAGMTQEEKEILAAAVEYALATNHWIRILRDRTLDNIRISLLKEPPEKDFSAGAQRYHMRFPYGRILVKNAEKEITVLTWSVEFFCGELEKELQKLPFPEPDPVEGEYREVPETLKTPESPEEKQIAASQENQEGKWPEETAEDLSGEPGEELTEDFSEESSENSEEDSRKFQHTCGTEGLLEFGRDCVIEDFQEDIEAAGIETYDKLCQKAAEAAGLVDFFFRQYAGLEIPLKELRIQRDKTLEMSKILSEMILLREAQEDG